MVVTRPQLNSGVRPHSNIQHRMGLCANCGKQTGFGVRLCPTCDSGRANGDPLADQRQQQRARVAEGKAREVQGLLDTVLERVERYGQVSLFRSVYIEVDSVIGEEQLTKQVDIAPLQALGLSGWEIVTCIPRTMGIELKNISIGSTSGRTYGGGMGGNVVGVHVLMQRIVRKPVAQEMHEELKAVLGENLPTRLPGHY